MIELTIIGFCLALNAVLAAVEMAFVTMTKPRLRELARSGHRDAIRILKLRENPERTLSVIQVGITLVGAAGAAVGGASASEYLEPWLMAEFGLSFRVAELASLLAVILPVTYLNVVVGELVPKTLALRNPTAIALYSAKWLVYCDRALSPIVSFLEWSTRVVLSLLKPKWVRKPSQTSGTEESVELDQLSSQTREYVLNLVDLEKKRIRDVRLPWNEVVSVSVDSAADEVARIVLESGHTRLPVLRIDSAHGSAEVAGILNTKEFMVLHSTGGGEWRELIRDVVRVDETAPIFRALRQMQDKRSHLSITYTSGKVSGIVTIEDILEEIIGDLFDEDDDGNLRRILSSGRRLRAIKRTTDRRDGKPEMNH